MFRQQSIYRHFGCMLTILVTVGLAGCQDNGRPDISGNAGSSTAGSAGSNAAVSGSSAGVINNSDSELLSEISLTTDRKGSHLFGGEEVSLYGEYCDYSGKEIRSKRYGAVAIDSRGKISRYRSVESMVWDMDDRSLDSGAYRFIGIVDFISAERLMTPEEMQFYYSKLLPSPGGSWVSAINPDAEEKLIRNIGDAYPGTLYSWDEIQEVLLQEKNSVRN